MIADKFDLLNRPYEENGVLVKNYEDSIKLLATTNGCNQVLANYIDDNQDKNEQFKRLRSHMPSETSDLLLYYQDCPNSSDKNAIDEEINKINCKLQKGQQILHGGHFEQDDFITKKPLSTTTDPQVAFREAEHMKKAYKNDRIDINILEVNESSTNVYAFDTEGTDHSNEKEILFASGAHIKKVKSVKLINDYPVYDECENMKKIPLYLDEFEIS